MRKNKFSRQIVLLLFAGGLLLLLVGCLPTKEPELPPTILDCPSDGLPPCTRLMLPEDTVADCAQETARDLSAYEELAADMSFEEVCHQVGLPDWETGSGLAILIYQLEDGSEVWLGFPGLQGELMYAIHVERDGSQTALFPED